MSTTDPATIADLEAQIWRRARRSRDLLAGLRGAAAHDEPWAWALAQAVELVHPVHAMREEARAMNLRWAEARGLTPHLWADRVAAVWPEDPAHPERFRGVQRRRLERALRHQLPWPAEHLATIVRGGEALARWLRGLLWIDEGGALRWIDDEGRTRDLEGGEAPARELRIAHPTHQALRGLDRGRIAAWIDPSAAPFPQVDRERFGPESVERDVHGWYRPRWSEPLPLFRLQCELRRGGWRYTYAEDNGTIAGIFLADPRADLTALWRLMNEQDQPAYGCYMLYGGFPGPDVAVRVGLVLLRGPWDRRRLGWSYHWPPNRAPYTSIQEEHLVAPEDADPIFLSEVIRDLRIASRPGEGG
ncbi:MAG: hypothetical protein R3B09_12755 [Nannocystaceae bacterium]